MTETTHDNDSFGAAGWCCSVTLHNAPLLNDMQRKKAECLFYDALMQRFGDVETAWNSYNVWTLNKESAGAQEWVAALMEARVPVHHALASDGDPAVSLDGDNCAHLEVRFTHDVD